MAVWGDNCFHSFSFLAIAFLTTLSIILFLNIASLIRSTKSLSWPSMPTSMRRNHSGLSIVMSSLLFSPFLWSARLERRSALTFVLPGLWWRVKLYSWSSVIHLAWRRFIFCGFLKYVRF